MNESEGLSRPINNSDVRTAARTHAIEDIAATDAKRLRDQITAASTWSYVLRDVQAAHLAAMKPIRIAVPDMSWTRTVTQSALVDITRSAQQALAAQMTAVNTVLASTLSGFDWSGYFDRLRRTRLPSNLSSLDWELLDRQRGVLLDGIPLCGVPRLRIARLLLEADTTQQRRAVIGANIDAILADCEALLHDEADLGLPFERASILEAITVMRDGHHRATQALAANVADSFAWHRYRVNDERPRQWNPTSDTLHVTPEMLMDAGPLETMTWLPVWATRLSFDPKDDTVPVPHAFNRHASLHRVSARQYSKRNATIAIMHATTLWLWTGANWGPTLPNRNFY